MRQVNAVGQELSLTIGNVFHAGDGNLHPCILFNEQNRDEVRKVIQAGERILEICVEYGGALSGEHGIGIEKQAYMPLVFTDEDMDAMKGLREAFLNPQHEAAESDSLIPSPSAPISERFNPGKIFPGGANHGEAYGITEHSVRRANRGDEV